MYTFNFSRIVILLSKCLKKLVWLVFGFKFVLCIYMYMYFIHIYMPI